VRQVKASAVAILCASSLALGCASPGQPSPAPAVHWVSPADSARWTQSQDEGSKHLAAHQNGEAERAFTDALDAVRAGGPRDPRTSVSVDSLLRVGQAYSERGDWVDLERVSRLVLDTEVVRSSSNPRVRLLAQKALVTSLAKQRRFDEALAEAAEGYEDAAQHYSPDSPIVLDWVSVQANVSMDAGQFADAEPGLRRVLEQRTHAEGSDTPSVGAALNDLAWCLVQQGRFTDAEPFARQSVALFEKVSPEPPELGASLDTLAEVERQLGRHDEAERDYRHAIVILRRFRPETDSLLISVLDHLATLLRGSGRTKDADAVNKELLAIRSDIANRSQPDQTQ
jgi:tetratricopeptide (TPR) repeat protein